MATTLNFADEIEVFYVEYSQHAILHAAHFRRVVIGKFITKMENCIGVSILEIWGVKHRVLEKIRVRK